jgi:cytochrome P450
VFTLFIAGNETTALTLSWAWCLLAQHPEVEQKLDQELTSVLSGRLLRVTDLPQLPYTQAIIKEVLRLYPPAWISFRQAKVDLQLGGYDIKQGEMIWLTPYIVQRDPCYFDQPAQFWPERFLPDETGQPLERRIPRFAYYPFGGGPRICLGNGFAMLEASLILATMAQRYRFQLAANQPVQMKARATLGFESQVPMQPVSR